MEDKFQEMVDELDLDEIEDFETKDATYQVWAYGYDKDMYVTDHKFLINESKDPNRAINQATKFIEEERWKTLSIPEDVYFLSIEVETTVDFEDHLENVGTIFQKGFRIKN